MSRPCPIGGVAALLAAATAVSLPAQLQSTLLAPANAGPATREFSTAYDAARGVTVIFAGLRLGLVRNEIYEWDGTNWSIGTVFPRPGPRGRPAIEFDAARGEIVMFGGVTGAGAFLDDTWTYNGPTFGQKFPATTPGARSGTWLAYDPQRQVVVMFGGFVASGQDSNDTWEWDGNDWSQVPVASPPLPRGAHRMVYDASREQVVMFGGFSTPAFATVNDTWQFDGTIWTPVATTNVPPMRCDQAMVFDELRGRVFMFGGLNAFQQPGNIPVVLGDCWVLEPNGWQPKTVPGLPSPRSYVLGAWDAQRQETVLQGGFDSVTNTYSETYRVETLTPADMTSYGSGCAGSVGVPDLQPDSLPWIGEYYQVSVTNVPTSTAGFMTVGLSDTVWNGMPIPVDLTGFGLAGCQAWLGPDFSALFFVNNGVGSWGLTVCNCPFAVGIQYSLQAVVLDPGAPNALGAVMSNAQRATIGNW